MSGTIAETAPWGTVTTDGQQAKRYSQFRPSYPEEVYQIILRHLNEYQKKLAIDVATGNGQAAVQLTQYFEQVIAADSNEEQLRHAKPAQNVTYRHSDAHSMDLPDNCADLVTVASALHWLELPRFYRECRRVLKPHGCLAAWAIPLGLAKLEVPAAPAAGAACCAALQHMYKGVLGKYWHERKMYADNLYEGLAPSVDDFQHADLHQLSLVVTLSVEQLVGYVSSWSAYSVYRKQHPDLADPLVHFEQQITQALQDQHGGQFHSMDYEGFSSILSTDDDVMTKQDHIVKDYLRWLRAAAAASK